MAGSKSDESLFSLEVIVERVENICVSCYKPSIAFRLLDFPSIVIRSERQELCTNEKTCEINSGKSCLFKMSNELLYERLQSTPLYIMLIDTASAKTKLVASATISLASCFQNILWNIENNGLDIPTVDGSKGEYPMYNLMGSQVATVRLGYRMFSFGIGITGHVDLSLSKQIKRKQKFLAELPSEKGNEVIKPPSSTSYSTKGDGISAVLLANPDIDQEIHATQTDAHTQTYSIDTTPLNMELPTLKEDTQTIHKQGNITRPPPLYYNSTSAFPRTGVVLLHQKYSSEKPSIKQSVTSRTLVANGSEEVKTSKPQYCDKSVQFCETLHGNMLYRNNASTQCLHDNDLGLPLIEALLNELSLVKAKYNANSGVPQKVNEQTKSSLPKQVKICETPPSGKVQNQKANKNIKAPVHPVAKKDVPKRTRSKGVLISRQPLTFKKSNLKYGTTKTQRLREALTKRPIRDKQNVVESEERYTLSEKDDFLNQHSDMQNSSVTVQESKQILAEDKSTMTKSDEFKDIAVQVSVSNEKLAGQVPKYLSQDKLLDTGDLNNVILGATYTNNAVALSDVLAATIHEADNQMNGKTHTLSHKHHNQNELEEPLTDKVLTIPGEFPTFSSVSPKAPVNSNTRYDNGGKSSGESQDNSSGYRMPEKSLGLPNKPVVGVDSWNNVRSSRGSLNNSFSSTSELSDERLSRDSKPVGDDVCSNSGVFDTASQGMSLDTGLGFVNTTVGEVQSVESQDKSISSHSKFSDKSLGLVSKPVGNVLSQSSYSDNFDSDESDKTESSDSK